MLQSERPKTARGHHTHYDYYSNSSASSSSHGSARDLCYSPIDSQNNSVSIKENTQYANSKEGIGRPRTSQGRRQNLIASKEQVAVVPHPPITMQHHNTSDGDLESSTNHPTLNERTVSALGSSSTSSDKSSRIATRQRPKTGYGRRRTEARHDTSSFESYVEPDRSRTSLHNYGRRPSLTSPADFPENGRRSSLNKFPVLPHIGSSNSRRSPYGSHCREEDIAGNRLDSPLSNQSSDDAYTYSWIKESRESPYEPALKSQSRTIYDDDREETRPHRNTGHQSYLSTDSTLYTPPPPTGTPELEGDASQVLEFESYNLISEVYHQEAETSSQMQIISPDNQSGNSSEEKLLKIALRLPDGNRHEVNIAGSMSLDDVIATVEKESLPSRTYSRDEVSVVDGNRRGINFCGNDLYKSLNELKIVDKTLLILELLLNEEDEES